jgi:hypothetical protein
MAALARDGCYLDLEAQGGGNTHAGRARRLATGDGDLLLIAAGPLLAIGARPLSDYAARTAAQLHAPGAYVTGVLGAGAVRPAARQHHDARHPAMPRCR